MHHRQASLRLPRCRSYDTGKQHNGKPGFLIINKIVLYCIMFKIHQYYVYMLTNKGNTVIYIGVTNDIQSRALDHKQGINKGFTKQYNCNKLVYFEEHQWIQDAIAREKQLKAGPRQKKIDLINLQNPEWED
jgi:putative endonuclease